MAIADNRQRWMPYPDDRLPGRGQQLAYPEAVLLVNPLESEFKGEVLPSFHTIHSYITSFYFTSYVCYYNMCIINIIFTYVIHHI